MALIADFIKDIIKKKSNLYGNSFEVVSRSLGCEPEYVALMLIAVKEARLEFLKNSQRTLKRGSPEYIEVVNALLDTEIDIDAYKWIKDNYEEYKKLIGGAIKNENRKSN